MENEGVGTRWVSTDFPQGKGEGHGVWVTDDKGTRNTRAMWLRRSSCFQHHITVPLVVFI